ncbi:hypothetical protein [Myxococcus xanthus]|uniref:hypothetical protein n=1 Tax=Myxococcus xanthus TaxID=34 RepID=UPI001F302651|nr:hypothetical protein [Myxococcus xanthus]
MIQARNLGAGHGPRAVLAKHSFDLPWRRASVVLGPGGSGKSTLLRAKRTVVLVTQHLPLARMVADHVLLIDDGMLVDQASPRDFFDEPGLRRHEG